jgi:outer membrane protein OmpA-like peptidoglycan-associated protein
MLRNFLPSLLLCCCGALSAAGQSGYDTARVLFPLNSTQLDAYAKQQLDSLAREIKDKKLLIYGYTDYLGNTAGNNQLAENRARGVAQYLKQNGVSDNDILLCTGAGQVNRSTQNGSEGYPEDRRVLLFIRKPQSAHHAMAFVENTGLPERPKPAANNGELADIAKMKPNQTIRIRNIHFVGGTHELLKVSEPALDELYNVMQANPKLAIRLEGHVCCMAGSGDGWDVSTNTYDLSLNRAKTVYDYLVRKGISKDRLSYAGLGHSKPIILNDASEEDAAINRRVEVKVIRNE